MVDGANSDARISSVLIPVGDQTVSAVRYASETDERVPALLTYTPYRSDDYATYYAYDTLYRYLADAGYEVIAADVLGTGASSGCKADPSESKMEGEQAATIVDWLADQQWTTDSVGVFGKSYPGGTAYAVAAEDPEPLGAVVTTHADFRTHGVGRTAGGSRNVGFMTGWIPMLATFAALPPSRRDADGRWATIWNERLSNLREQETSPATWLLNYVTTIDQEEEGTNRSIDPGKISVPVLTATGWRDSVSPQASFDGLSQVEAPTRLHIGPWRHTMPYRGRETQTEFRTKMVNWFDHFLKGEETDVLDGPRIEYWTERHGGGKIDGGVWRGRESWPSVDAAETQHCSYTVTPDGLRPLSAPAEALEVTYDVDHTVGMQSLEYKSPPLDTNADDSRSLCFNSEPLENPIEWTGTGEVCIRVTAKSSDPLFAARVVDVAPDGTASLVSHGHYQNRGMEDGETSTNVRVQLKPVSHIFERGHRIRLAISGAYFPRLIPPRDHDSFVFHSSPQAPSVLRFPGMEHDGGVLFDDTIPVPERDEHSSAASPFLIDTDSQWETAREHGQDAGIVRNRESTSFELPHGGVMEWEADSETVILANDPSAFHASAEALATLVYETETVTVQTKSRATLETAQVHQTVRIDDQPVFEHTWRA